MDVIKYDAREYVGTAIIAVDESVWIAVQPAWWDIPTRVWWWLAPSERKAYVVLTNKSGHKVRTRAICVARKHVRIGAVPRGDQA